MILPRWLRVEGSLGCSAGMWQEGQSLQELTMQTGRGCLHLPGLWAGVWRACVASKGSGLVHRDPPWLISWEGMWVS